MPNVIQSVAPVVPVLGRKKLKKVALDTITSEQVVKTMRPRELLFMHLRFHQLFKGNFAGNDQEKAGGLDRAHLLKLHKWLAAEMIARHYFHKPVPAMGDVSPAKSRKAIVVTAPHGQMLLRGTQRMFLHLKELKPGPYTVVEEDPRLTESIRALGEVRLLRPTELSRGEIRKHKNLHRLSSVELRPFDSGAYAYDVEVIKEYPKPRLTKIKMLAKAATVNVIAFLFDTHGRAWVSKGKTAWTPPMGQSAQTPEAAAYQLVTTLTTLKVEPCGHLPPFETKLGTVFPFVFLAEESTPTHFFTLDALSKMTPLSPSLGMFVLAQHILIEPTIDFVRAQDRPDTLTPAQLAETDTWLHVLGRTETAVHEVIKAEMERRHISHDLKKSEFRLTELQALHDAVPSEIVVVQDWASISGSTVYAKDREPNDVDWIFRDPMPTQGAILKLARITQARAGRPAHFSLEGSGPSWPSVPIYDLVARRRPEVTVHGVDEPDFAKEFYKADLPSASKDLTIFHPFAHYKAGHEFYPTTETDLSKWAAAVFAKGGTLAVSEKYDGMRMHVHFDKASNELKVFTESGRERSSVFPGLDKALQQLTGKVANARNFILDCEFVQWDQAPLPRWEMTWMIVGTTGPAVPVRISIHDIMWLDDKSLVDQPYADRMKELDKILPQPVTEGLYTFVPAPIHWATSEAELKAAVDWARREVDSEGAMIKSSTFLYNGSHHPEIVKFKNTVEIEVAVIGWKKNPAPRPSGETWTEKQAMAKLPEQLRLSRTYIFRVAIKDGARSIALDSDKVLTARDLQLHWNETDQKWEGTDDPKLWTMDPNFPSRTAGDYPYANTYAFAMADPPFFGQILTVAPMQFRPFKKQDGGMGSVGYSWLFPKVKSTKPVGYPVGQLADILAAFGANPSGRTGVQKDAQGARQGIMIALPIPLDVAQSLLDVAHQAMPTADLIPARELHLTLIPIGTTDAPPPEAKLLPSIVREVSMEHSALVGKINGFGRFAGANESSIYASFDSPDLPTLFQDLVDELDWLPKPEHGFTPHITLGYLPSQAPMPDLKIPTAQVTLPEIAVAWGTQWITFELGTGVVHRLQKADFPSEEKVHPFVVQHHFRGKSAHADFRFEFSDYLIGWTVMDLEPGVIKEPVLTLAQAKAEDAKPSNWKIDWSKGEIRQREIKGGVVRRADLRVAPKAKEIPHDWLTVQGVTTKPDSGDQPPAGATQNYPGVFSIIDKGTVEYGAQKPWAKEYFLHGSKLKGRWMVRLLTRTTKAPLPRGVVDPSARTPDYWVLMQPQDQTPYVLNAEALQKDWLPPKGISALPKQMRDSIPPKWQYWKMSGAEALAARRDLATHFEEIGGTPLKKDAVIAVVDFQPA